MAIQDTFIARSYEGGVAYVVPQGTDLPTAVGTLDPEIKAGDLGTLAVDGLTIAETRESETIPDFDGDDYITFQKKYSVEIKFKLLDVDKESVLDFLNGAGNVAVTAEVPGTSGKAIAIDHKGEQLPVQGFVFTTKSGDKVRFDTMELGRVSDVSEFKLESQDASGVEVTIKGSKDGSGSLFHTYTQYAETVTTP